MTIDHPRRGVALFLSAVCAGCGGSAFSPSGSRAPLSRGAEGTGLVYVLNSHDQAVTMYAAAGGRDRAPLSTVGGPQSDIQGPTGISVGADGRIYVASSFNSSIAVFAPPASKRVRFPIAIIAGGETGVGDPKGVALDAAGRIYVLNGYGPSVTVYAANPRGNVTGAPLATIHGSATQLLEVEAIAVGPHGEIAVVNGAHGGYVTIYARDPRGVLNEAPKATISGANTDLNDPVAIAEDGDGDIYVANAAPSKGAIGTITVYPPPRGTYTGAPLAVIGGIRSGVALPHSVTLDGTGQIYVANEYENSVTTYAANPSGNVDGPPLAVLRGRATRLAHPIGLAVHQQ